MDNNEQMNKNLINIEVKDLYKVIVVGTNRNGEKSIL